MAKFKGESFTFDDFFVGPLKQLKRLLRSRRKQPFILYTSFSTEYMLLVEYMTYKVLFKNTFQSSSVMICLFEYSIPRAQKIRVHHRTKYSKQKIGLLCSVLAFEIGSTPSPIACLHRQSPYQPHTEKNAYYTEEVFLFI